MPRAARLILATALIATVLVGPAAQSAKAPPSTPTEDEPPMICIEDPCWGEGCEDDCGCEDQCGGGETIDPCDHVPCGIVDPCDHVNCDPDPCNYVNCNPDIQCHDKPCPLSGHCIPDPAAPTEGGNLLCTRSTVCGYLAQLPVGGTVDCVERVCDLEEDLQANLVYTGDRDGDGIEDCHDPDVDGDGLSNALEDAIGYDPGSKKSDADGIPDAFDLVPGKDANVKVWVRIARIEQADWEDVISGPDPYLKDRAGLSIDGSVPDGANRLSFDGLREGDHIHDTLDVTFKTSDGKNYEEVASEFPQRWHPLKYPSLEDGGKLGLEWELPLWEHDAADTNPLTPHDDTCDGDCDDEKAAALDTSDVFLQLLKVAQEGHHPGTVSTEGDTITGPSGGDPDTMTTWMTFGNDASLKLEIGANLPQCPVILGNLAWDMTPTDPDRLGNAYVGVGELPPNGETLTSVQENRCDINEDSHTI